MISSVFLKNTFAMYVLTVVKLILPLVTLPYLTRILSVETYGIVAYVKAIMGYVQVFIDFGFIFSATQLVALAVKTGKYKYINEIISSTLLAKVLLVCMSSLSVLYCYIKVPVLSNYGMFIFLMLLSTILTIFWMDFYFRGIEKMEIITYRFLFSKGVATIMIFLFVKSDADLILMGVIEVIGTVIAAVFSVREMLKQQIKIYMPNLSAVFYALTHSGLYFCSTVSSTSFNLLITFLIGLYLAPKDVAYWSLAFQFVFGVQMLYGPITDALYPRMIKCFDKKLVYKLLIIMMPIIIIGCLVLYLFADWLVIILAGIKYLPAAEILIYLIPLLLIAFPTILLGWPVLGAAGMVKQVTITTILASITQVVLLICLIAFGAFTLLNISVVRCITEFVFFVSRLFFVIKYRVL